MNSNLVQRRNFSTFFRCLLLIALTGCSTKSNDDSWLLVGTWTGTFRPTPTYAAPVTANFSADGAWDWTFKMKRGTVMTSGTWANKDTKLLLTNQAIGETTSHEFHVTKDTLTIEDVPFAGILTLKKQKYP